MSAETETTPAAEGEPRRPSPAGPRKAYRDALFRRWVDTQREAKESEDPADHRTAIDAYLAFMRAHLAEEEQSRVHLENEVARLTAENAALRRGRQDRAA